MSKGFRITYSALSADLTELHKEFDAALANLKASLGYSIPSIVNGKKVESGKVNKKTSPTNTSLLIANYHVASEADLNEAFTAAKRAQKIWGATPWTERVAITKKAADIMRERRMRIAALMVLEVGKNRMESLGDAEEAADLLAYYADQMEQANGYIQPLAKLSPNENTKDVLRPYGVFSVIAPFNFPMALGAGMTSAALLGGNSVILKPSDDAPGTAYEIYLAYRDAGLPEGVLQVVFGNGPALGEWMVKHPMCDGVAFTGSKMIGMSIIRTLNSGLYAKPALVELGGKNAAFVCESADLEKAANGCVRSAFGLSGQKCSALSRLYVHEKIYPEFVEKLLAAARKLVSVGDPANQEIYMGPVINQRAVERHLTAISEARAIGKILWGGTDLREKSEFKAGHFADPTIAELPSTSRHFKDEFFSPFLAVTKFSSLPDAITDANKAEYGLTSGIFTAKKEEIDLFMDSIEAGVLYANRATGATTGAWPGVQSFCGWKGSGGGSGKGGCGPYYVMQFMREQSRTIME
jgi:1-pyrroline-5-carboxylate dehydrogenase